LEDQVSPTCEPPTGNTAAWLQVWLDAGPEGQVFTYANPAALPAGVGDLVRVRLQGRLHAGLVVECLSERPAALEGKQVLPVVAILQAAAVDPRWRSLLETVARECHTSLFRCLKAALPPGWLGQRSQPPALAGRRPILVELEPVSVSPPVPAPGGGDPEPRRATQPTARQGALLLHLASRGGGELLPDLLRQGFSRTVVAGAEARGLVRRRPLSQEEETRRLAASLSAASRPAAGPPGDLPPGPEAGEPGRCANSAQARAIAAIAAAPAGATLLLWGVTGSGKTEVYLQAAGREVESGHSVLVLAPEIGLIPQLLDRCQARFGSRVLEYHSGMGEAERVRAWRRCLAAAEGGDPLVAVGTRSAVFLPLGNLGLIVLDEEHDGSYKQDAPMPCYHAREVARQRVRLEGGRLLLGSATPSLETWLRCQGPEADTQLLELPERIAQRPLPPVRLVDMRLELAEGHRSLVSRALMERLRQLPERGEQGVVLVPRRGYRTFQSCRSCGEAVLCPHCDVALTVHRHSSGREWLRCHWCDHRQEADQRCGHCGSTAFKAFGAGTQRVLEQLAHDLEGLRLLRFDADTTRGRDGHRRLLAEFAAGGADVLVGTQMLAKGMDLPRVTLAAVLAADGLLHRPDLRSAETCLQLLLQLAGRAGRGERPGEVLVQTYCPEHPVIRHLVDGRYGSFLEEEADLRRRAALVPFSRAALVRVAGPSASATATAAASVAALLANPVRQAGWELIGPAPAPVARVAGRSRWQILLHGPAGTPVPLPPLPPLQRALARGVSLAIDPDPLEL
jgi:primosomal protein N' (replication factor Y)